MKFLKYSLFVILTVFVVFACTDESLVPEPEPETAVHGYIEATSSDVNFVYTFPSRSIDLDFQWISIDSKNTVEKIEFYVYFTEEYIDWEGGTKIANHGSRLWTTLDGANIPANRTTTSLSITQGDVYDLFSDATYAYDVVDGDDPTENVFGNTLKPERNATTSPLVAGDAFQIKWILYTADGRVFDTWNDSICLEFPGANCTYAWGVICESDLAGNYSLTSTWTDYYGVAGGGTYSVTIAEVAPATYSIPDLSGGMEPEIWSNPAVAAQFVDQCGTIVLDQANFSYLYGYSILSGSGVNATTGVITIVWENEYGENGVNVYTPL